jgi:phosphoribosylamine-glycine ligase
MLTAAGPKVIEYNVRFGDPETQSAMMLLTPTTDLANVLLSCTNGTLEQSRTALGIKPGFACNIVIASGGYPGEYQTNKTVTLHPIPSTSMLFHAGTKWDQENVRAGSVRSLKTAGGRVFSVAAYGSTLSEAVRSAYEGINGVDFDGMVFRKDIAARLVS